MHVTGFYRSFQKGWPVQPTPPSLRWRHALPDEGIDVEALRAAAAEELHCAGDWITGEARLHAAIAGVLDVADRVVADASEA